MLMRLLSTLAALACSLILGLAFGLPLGMPGLGIGMRLASDSGPPMVLFRSAAPTVAQQVAGPNLNYTYLARERNQRSGTNSEHAVLLV